MAFLDFFRRKPKPKQELVVLNESASGDSFNNTPANVEVGITNIRLDSYAASDFTPLNLMAKYDTMDSTEPLFSAALNILAADIASNFRFSSPNSELADIGFEYFYKSLNIGTDLFGIVRAKLKYGSAFLENSINNGKFSSRLRSDLLNIVELQSMSGDVYYVELDQDNKQENAKSRFAFSSFYYNKSFGHDIIKAKQEYPLGKPLYIENSRDESLEFRLVQGRSLFYPLLNLFDFYEHMTKTMVANREARSKVFNLVGIEVTGRGDKEAANHKNDVKNALERGEGLDLYTQRYLGQTSPVPENSNIYYTTRNQVGAITIERIGEQGADVSSISDIDNIENRIVAGLIVPRRLLLPYLKGGSLGDNSLEIEYKNYEVTVGVLKSETESDLEQAFEDYLDLIGFPKDKRTYSISLSTVSKADNADYQNTLSTALQNATTLLGLLKEYPKFNLDKGWDYILNNIIGIDPELVSNDEIVEHVKEVKFGTLNSSRSLDHPSTQDSCGSECEIDYSEYEVDSVDEGYYPEDSQFVNLTEFIGRDVAVPLFESLIRTGGDSLNSLIESRTLNESTANELLDIQKALGYSKTNERAKGITGRFVGVNANGDLIFSMNSATTPGKNYDVIIRFKSVYNKTVDAKMINEPKVFLSLLLSDDDVLIYCSCPSWLYWGAQYNATIGEYGAERPEMRRPRVRPDIKLNFVLCKHVQQVLSYHIRTNWARITQALRTVIKSTNPDSQ